MTDRCKRCGCYLPFRARRDHDPYCSTECCQRDYGIKVEDGLPYNRRITRLQPNEPSDRWRGIPAFPQDHHPTATEPPPEGVP